jgi:N-acyl amino acid synthase of PEP-CTERM/exosortase system
MYSVFELRYQVYCLERGYLPASDYPDGMEQDNFDRHSDHFCEFDELGSVVGYARLVKPDEKGFFPFQYHCDQLLDGVMLPPREESVEVSRLIVRCDYRRARADSEIVVEGVTSTHRNASGRDSQSRLILPRLYRQMVVHSLTVGRRYWFAAMERVLARSLLQMGYPFKQITPNVDYYGPVSTYMLDMEELQDRLAVRNPAHLAWLTTPDAEAIVGSMPPLIDQSIPSRSRVPAIAPSRLRKHSPTLPVEIHT